MAVGRREDAPVRVPQAHVDVARVALALVVLGHERERAAVQVGDLLGPVLVDRMVVGHRQRVGIAEVDLVLAEVALALGVLHTDAGPGHAEPDRADDVLDHGRAEDRVVDVVRVRGDQVVVALRPGLVEAVAEEHELELRSGLGRPSPLGQPVELAAQDLAR